MLMMPHPFCDLSQDGAKLFSGRCNVSIPCADNADRNDLRDSDDRAVAQTVSRNQF